MIHSRILKRTPQNPFFYLSANGASSVTNFLVTFSPVKIPIILCVFYVYTSLFAVLGGWRMERTLGFDNEGSERLWWQKEGNNLTEQRSGRSGKEGGEGVTTNAIQSVARLAQGQTGGKAKNTGENWGPSSGFGEDSPVTGRGCRRGPETTRAVNAFGYHALTTGDPLSADKLQRHTRREGLLWWSSGFFNPATNLSWRAATSYGKGWDAYLSEKTSDKKNIHVALCRRPRRYGAICCTIAELPLRRLGPKISASSCDV